MRAGLSYPTRKTQSRILVQGASYFITSVTSRRFPFFSDPNFADLLACTLWFGAVIKEYDLIAYCVLPDHVHILFKPNGATPYHRIVGSIKRNAARDINDMILNRPFVRNLESGNGTLLSVGDDGGTIRIVPSKTGSSRRTLKKPTRLIRT